MPYIILALVDIGVALSAFANDFIGTSGENIFLGILLLINATAILSRFYEAISFYFKRKGLEQKKKALQTQKELDNLQTS